MWGLCCFTSFSLVRRGGYCLVLVLSVVGRSPAPSHREAWAQKCGTPGLSCSGACGIFSDQGSNPVSCIGRNWATREAPGLLNVVLKCHIQGEWIKKNQYSVPWISGFPRMVLRQQHQHYLEACYEHQVPVPILIILNSNMHPIRWLVYTLKFEKH